MALANGTSRIKTGPVTLHTQTAIHFAEQLAKVSVLSESWLMLLWAPCMLGSQLPQRLSLWLTV